MKAVTQLPQEQQWQAPKRVFYGKDQICPDPPAGHPRMSPRADFQGKRYAMRPTVEQPGFISFLDSSSATHFHSDAILKKLAIKGNDIKIGWGKMASEWK
jgi:hypothetical protein